MNATRKHRVIAGTLATFLVAGAAFAYYTAIVNDGTGSFTPSPFGANGSAPTTFVITAGAGIGTGACSPSGNAGVAFCLQPGTTQCSVSGAPAVMGPASDCSSFNLQADATNTTTNGEFDSVTLTSITLPPGCPDGSLRVVWPNQTWGDGNPSGPTGDTNTYNEPTPIPFTKGSSAGNNDLFPAVGETTSTVSGQPLMWFYDTGANQNACAGGTATLTFTAHANAT